VLGVHFGDDAKVSDKLQQEASGHEMMFTRIECLPLHAAVAMIQQSALPRMNHIVRCHPPSITKAACSVFDNLVEGAWATLARVNPSDKTRQIAALPHRFGGAGFTRMTTIASHAYLASVESCSVESSATKPRSQKQRCDAAYATAKQQLLGDAGTAAHLEECSAKGTGLWMKNVAGVDTWIPDDCVSAALRLRLNQPHRDWQSGDHCPGCHAPLTAHDTIVQHLRGCTRIRGHNSSASAAEITKVLGDILNAASVPHETTQPRDCEVRYCASCGSHVPVADTQKHCSERGCDIDALGRAKICGPDKRMFFRTGPVVVDTTSVGPATASQCALGLNKCFELRTQKKNALYRASVEARSEEFIVMAMTPNGAICAGTDRVMGLVGEASRGVLPKSEALVMLRRGNVQAQARGLINAERAAGISDTDFATYREQKKALHSERIRELTAKITAARPKACAAPIAPPPAPKQCQPPPRVFSNRQATTTTANTTATGTCSSACTSAPSALGPLAPWARAARRARSSRRVARQA
jgi:hypothetical protein